MKKHLFKTPIVLGLSLISVFQGCSSEGLCENEHLSTTLSPDGKHKVVVFQRDCGATTGFSTQISIIDAPDSLPPGPGNIFVAEMIGDGLFVEVSWIINNEIKIEYNGGSRVFKARNEFNGFVVHYEELYEELLQKDS